jgi:hypothetical protein
MRAVYPPFVVGRGKNIDNLSKRLGFQSVDVVRDGGQSADLALTHPDGALVVEHKRVCLAAPFQQMEAANVNLPPRRKS